MSPRHPDERHPDKRAAFEPLAAPIAADPAMPRPVTTVAGGVLVLLRAVTALAWGLTVVIDVPPWVHSLAALATGELDVPLSAADYDVSDAVFFALVAAVAVVQLVFGILVLRGSNAARVIVMISSTLTILASFAAWWDGSSDITIRTTLITLALDILVLLALSSRSAAAWARRGDRRRRRPRRRRP